MEYGLFQYSFSKSVKINFKELWFYQNISVDIFSVKKEEKLCFQTLFVEQTVKIFLTKRNTSASHETNAINKVNCKLNYVHSNSSKKNKDIFFLF